MNALWKTLTSVATKAIFPTDVFNNKLTSLIQSRTGSSLNAIHKRNMKRLENPVVKIKQHILNGKPFAKGVVLKTVVRKPRKPNSANRKCVVVRLSTGKTMVSYVPGIGHNLQEHQVVLCKISKLKDVPGVKLKCVRGKYDLPHPNKAR